MPVTRDDLPRHMLPMPDPKHVGIDNAKAPETHTIQHFEMFGNRGLYHDGWTAATKHRTPWKACDGAPVAVKSGELSTPAKA